MIGDGPFRTDERRRTMALHINQQPLASPLSDEKIIDLYWQKDEAAIKQTDLKYRNYLYTVAYNIVHDHLDCEKCLNDTYLGAWNAMPPERPGILKAFLTTIMRRIAINRYNHNNRQKRVPSELTHALSELEDVLSEKESSIDDGQLGQILTRFIMTLSTRQRYIFMSRYYTAESIDVIANTLSVSRSTVNKEIAVIKRDLKNMLESEGYFI